MANLPYFFTQLLSKGFRPQQSQNEYISVVLIQAEIELNWTVKNANIEET